MDKVGYIYVCIITIYSIVDIWEWVISLELPSWVKVIFLIIGFILWFSGLAFLYEAEKTAFKSNK